ncbi:MAG TPA: NUDIX domain-containing protein [Candidatus Angelobacter sp.]|jgi:8-oxo-dGTP diphosphatase
MSIQVTVDIVIFTILDARLKLLLIRRGIPPFKDSMAIPGGFVLENESLDAAALRELKEETGVDDVYLEQLYSFGDPKRDPRGRVVTVAYYALIPAGHAIKAGSDASAAEWRDYNELPDLAFDHNQIVHYAVERLRNKLEYTTAGFSLLPEQFTLSELQSVYEVILGRKLDKRNFRKKLELLGVLKASSMWRKTGRKPARLYRFSAKKFEKLKDKGILFPF